MINDGYERAIVTVCGMSLDDLKGTFGYAVYESIYSLTDKQYVVVFGEISSYYAWVDPFDDDFLLTMNEKGARAITKIYKRVYCEDHHHLSEYILEREYEEKYEAIQ